MEYLYPKALAYKQEKFHEVRDLYQELANSQSPKSLMVTCSDSRLSPQQFTASLPGEVFVVRSAGNLITPYCPDVVTNDAISLEYGVVALGVKEIVVCGHVSCGAMTGVMNIEALDAMPLVQKSLKAYKEKYIDEIQHIEKLDTMIQWNVCKQLEHIMSYPFVKERVKNGELTLWGWVFDFVSHEIVYKKNYFEMDCANQDKAM